MIIESFAGCQATLIVGISLHNDYLSLRITIDSLRTFVLLVHLEFNHWYALRWVHRLAFCIQESNLARIILLVTFRFVSWAQVLFFITGYCILVEIACQRQITIGIILISGNGRPCIVHTEPAGFVEERFLFDQTVRIIGNTLTHSHIYIGGFPFMVEESLLCHIPIIIVFLLNLGIS